MINLFIFWYAILIYIEHRLNDFQKIHNIDISEIDN